MYKYLSILSSLLCFSCASIGSSNLAKGVDYVICTEDPEKYEKRSAELQTIVDADQADREGGVMKPGAVFRDRERRQRVGQIFGEGCFKSAKDFANAALVYQHGDQSDHYLQTFLWSKRSVELGYERQKRMMAFSIDRYLISKGHKQLFASQASKVFDSPCWCLQQVESTLPAELRKQYMGTTLEDQIRWVDEMNVSESCPSPNYCARDLKNSLRGIVPGFW